MAQCLPGHDVDGFVQLTKDDHGLTALQLPMHGGDLVAEGDLLGAIVGALTQHEVLDEVVQGFSLDFLPGDQHGRRGSIQGYKKCWPGPELSSSWRNVSRACSSDRSSSGWLMERRTAWGAGKWPAAKSSAPARPTPAASLAWMNAAARQWAGSSSQACMLPSW